MSRSFKYLPFVFLVTISVCSVFFFDLFAIEKGNQFRPLANGWVSIYPEIHLDDSLTSVQKIQSVVEADLVHGRFRPAFFTYVSTAYFLSPFVHGRLSEKPERNHKNLMTGDLRLFSYLLLVSVVVSMVLVSLLIFRLSGSILFTTIPVFFIPLSPSLTENLLQNYIDSQAIPLVLWACCWLFFFFSPMIGERKRWLDIVSRFLSCIFLALFFLTKETSVIVIGAQVLILLILFWGRSLDFNLKFTNKSYLSSDVYFSFATLIYGVVFVALVLGMTMLHKTGYSTAYGMDYEKIRIGAVNWWNCMSIVSLNNYFGFVPVISAFFVLIARRKGEINRIPTVYHLGFFFALFALSYGFLAILIPWEPVLVKYTYPSIFFLAFLVGYSLSLLYVVAKESIYSKFRYVVLCLLIVYISLYSAMFSGATLRRNFDSQTANYGVSTIFDLAKSIQEEVQKNRKRINDILVVYEASGEWTHSIPWTRLHLKRWLNLEGGLNILKRNHSIQKNISMPKGELTSFRFKNGNQSVFLSTKRIELERNEFDLVYLGFLDGEEPPASLFSSKQTYKLSGQISKYIAMAPYQSFGIYKYLPSSLSDTTLTKNRIH